MLADKLHILLITFNRGPELRSTLQQLLDGPFAQCRITVVDNHSTDETPEICREFAERFPRMEIMRHRYNIGGGPNYLRAVEASEGEYTWVLADDDNLSWAEYDDVVEVIEQGSADLISAGAAGREHWPRGAHVTARELVHDYGRFFYVFTFIPNTIFRTSLFDSMSMSEGYRLVSSLYPQFEFLRRQYERNASVYVSRGDIVQRVGTSTPVSSLYWFTRVVRTMQTVSEPELRKRLIYEIDPTPRSWRTSIAVFIAWERLYFEERVWEEIGELLLLLRGEQRLWLALAAPIALLPRPVLAFLQRLLRRARGQSHEDAPGSDHHSVEQRP